MIRLNGQPINVTRFPDRTSQVWKLDFSRGYNIQWDYEHDGEIFHLAQLLDLAVQECEWAMYGVDLFIPYFPYARQDKDIDNQSTFALETLMSILNPFFPCLNITTVDVHSKKPYNLVDEYTNAFTPDCDRFIVPFHNTYPKSLLNRLQGYDILIFPDKGAKDRYSKLGGHAKKYSMHKVRNQQTGEITHMDFDDGIPKLDGYVAVVDDICDGGRTFIGVADAIQGTQQNYECLDLIVTHGIFSNVELLDELTRRYDEIITTDSLYQDFDWYSASKQDMRYRRISHHIDKYNILMEKCTPGVDFEL